MQRNSTHYATGAMDVAFFGFNVYGLAIALVGQSDHLKNATMICAVAWNMIDVVGTAMVGYHRANDKKVASAVDTINAVQLFACTVPAMCYLADSHLVSEALATQLAGTSFALAMLLRLASNYSGSKKLDTEDALQMGFASLGMGLIAAGSFIANNATVDPDLADLINIMGLGIALGVVFIAGLTRFAMDEYSASHSP